MTLEQTLEHLSGCFIPELDDYSTLQRIEEDEFYFSPPLKEVNKDEQSKFILFSAPGAVGKTSLAKYIARHFHGLYWNVAINPLNKFAFAGVVSHAIGVKNGARQETFYGNLRGCKNFLILDAFDEADLISGHEGIKEFLLEMGEILSDTIAPTVILTARTEMAQFIQNVCKNASIGITCYSIDYFEDAESSKFIVEYLKYHKCAVGAPQKENIEKYLADIKCRLGSEEDKKSFIGYAQVLSIIARHMEVEAKTNPLLNDIHLSAKPSENSEYIIYSIIQQLISREQKKLETFKESIRDKYIKLNREDVIDSLYCKKEQLIRLQFFTETNQIQVDDSPNCKDLLAEDSERYKELLEDWLPQHVFLRDKTVMPIFCDYLLAESLLDTELEMFTEMYQTRLPTRAFMDCYLSLNKNYVNSEHIYYIDLAYSSQAETGNKAYCDIGFVSDDAIEADNDLSLFLTLVDEKESEESSISLKIIREANAPICLCRAENLSVNVDGKVILSPSFLKYVTIRQSSIECDELELNAPIITFETYDDEENFLIIHKALTRAPNSKINFKGTKRLKVDFPEDNLDQYKRQFFEFNPYLYSFGTESSNMEICDDIQHFAYGLKKALEQFKVDRYVGDPAKFKEKIDARCHSGCKRTVLNFLKDIDFIYEDGPMYKASLSKMDELKISRVAYTHGQYDQLQYAYGLYQEWFSKNTPQN